ncbi:MAG: GAF domain-containing protein [Dehalococcoidia bacterium]|nr:GAF domain-containing protein [Dehalococcoidia bacterium]
MRPGVSIQQRIKLLTNLSILVWVSILNAIGKATRNWLLSLLLRVPPDLAKRAGRVGNAYQLIQEQLGETLQLVEQRDIQLDESRDQLKKSRDLLQNTIDSLDEELVVLDHHLRITQANRKLRAKLKDKEITGLHCYEVSHGLDHPCRPPCACPLTQVWETGQYAGVIHTHETVQGNHHKARFVEVSAWPIFDAAGRIIQVVELARDITENKEQENRILEANQYLLALNAIGDVVSQTLNLDSILNAALDKTLELIKADAGNVLLIDEKTHTVSCAVQRGLPEHFFHTKGGIIPDNDTARKLIEQGETLVVDDIDKNPASTGWLITGDGLKAFIGVPLKSKKKVVGVLNIAGRNSRLFSRQDIHLLSAIGSTLGIAIENARLYQDVRLKEETRTELLRRVISAQEDERRRVARELHDVTSQALATVAVRLEAIANAPGATARNTENQFQDIRTLLATTSKEVHGLIYDLRPPLLDDLGLPAALQSCAQRTLAATGVQVHFEVAGREKVVPQEVAITVFRIGQEAITNIARHAKAESAYISLEFRDKGISVQIEDDGIGFDTTKPSSPSSGPEAGIGILGMKERASLLGGTVNIESKPGNGTRINAEIPVIWKEGVGE